MPTRRIRMGMSNTVGTVGTDADPRKSPILSCEGGFSADGIQTYTDARPSVTVGSGMEDESRVGNHQTQSTFVIRTSEENNRHHRHPIVTHRHRDRHQVCGSPFVTAIQKRCVTGWTLPDR